jgi:hypothetical protein
VYFISAGAGNHAIILAKRCSVTPLKCVCCVSIPLETRPGKPPESRHQRRAQEKEMKKYMATLHAMLAHHCDNAFFDMKFGHNPFAITLATPLDMMHLFESGIVKRVCQTFVDSMSTNIRV